MCWLMGSRERAAWLLSWQISAYMVLHHCQQCSCMRVQVAKYALQGVKRHMFGRDREDLQVVGGSFSSAASLQHALKGKSHFPCVNPKGITGISELVKQ